MLTDGNHTAVRQWSFSTFNGSRQQDFQNSLYFFILKRNVMCTHFTYLYLNVDIWNICSYVLKSEGYKWDISSHVTIFLDIKSINHSFLPICTTEQPALFFQHCILHLFFQHCICLSFSLSLEFLSNLQSVLCFQPWRSWMRLPPVPLICLPLWGLFKIFIFCAQQYLPQWNQRV